MAYKAEDFLQHIPNSRGIVTVIAKRMGCNRNTVTNAMNRFPTVRQAIEEEREGMKDFTEGKLFEQINAGNMTAIIFYLKTQAKDRGYVERVENTGADGNDQQYRVIIEYANSED